MSTFFTSSSTWSASNTYSANCTCGAWMAVVPAGPCPIHSGPPPSQSLGDWPYFYPDYYFDPYELTDEDVIAGLREIEEDLR